MTDTIAEPDDLKFDAPLNEKLDAARTLLSKTWKVLNLKSPYEKEIEWFRSDTCPARCKSFIQLVDWLVDQITNTRIFNDDMEIPDRKNLTRLSRILTIIRGDLMTIIMSAGLRKRSNPRLRHYGME